VEARVEGFFFMKTKPIGYRSDLRASALLFTKNLALLKHFLFLELFSIGNIVTALVFCSVK
jgi:hypothetical protein